MIIRLVPMPQEFSPHATRCCTKPFGYGRYYVTDRRLQLYCSYCGVDIGPDYPACLIPRIVLRF